MGSFHTFKATAPSTPDKQAAPSTPDSTGYFGWQVPERLRQRARGIQTVSVTDVTPERILSAIRGIRTVSPGMEVMEPETDYNRLAREREERQIAASQGIRL